MKLRRNQARLVGERFIQKVRTVIGDEGRVTISASRSGGHDRGIGSGEPSATNPPGRIAHTSISLHFFLAALHFALHAIQQLPSSVALIAAQGSSAQTAAPTTSSRRCARNIMRERAAKFNIEKVRTQDLAGAARPFDEVCLGRANVCAFALELKIAALAGRID